MPSHVHTLNSSQAHQKYSFSKQTRLKYDKPKTDAYYMPNMQKDRRSALIGYGERSLATINSKMNASTPHAYTIPSSISVKNGPSFSSGRHESGGPFESLKYLKQCPSPMNYNVSSSLEKVGGKFGLKLKDFSLKYQQGIPGPAQYTLPSTVDGSDGKGKKISDSRFSSGGSYKIGKLNQSLEFKQNPNKFQVPGPGQYQMQKYGLANPENPMQKHSSVKIGRQKRSNYNKRGSQKEPGPGEYKMYSEFD